MGIYCFVKYDLTKLIKTALSKICEVSGTNGT